MILRMVLLPSDSAKYNSEPKLYQHFFATNGPHVILRLLCSHNDVITEKLRHSDTYASFMSALVELCRFITVISTKRDEMDLIMQRKQCKMHQNTLQVLTNLDQFMFDLGLGWPS